MNGDRDLRRDEDLLAVLGEALDDAEPIRHDRIDAAIDLAFALGSIEEHLALVADSLSNATTGFRSDENDTRSLRFEAEGLALELDIDRSNNEVVGQILPPAAVPTQLESLTELVPVEVDDAGRFVLYTAARQFRLRLSIDGRGHVTAWVFR